MLDTQYIKSLKNIVFSKLIHLGIVQYGSFTLKNGTQSNIYMDLRQLVNYPQFFKYLTKLLFMQYPQLLETFQTNSLCKLIPIPLGGLPFGFHLAAQEGVPLLMIRDKSKDHGLKRMIEGVIEPGDEYYIIEDVITSGKSINDALDIISPHLESTYKTIICICNRSGMETMRDGIPIYSIFKLDELDGFITSNTPTPKDGIINYFKYTTPFANKLYSLALEKHSNLIISCDFMTNSEILELLAMIGDYIIAVKLHIDILEASSFQTFITELNKLKATMNFLVIEDAKFADIDSIMIEKINHSQLDIKGIADSITIHGISGLSILEGDKLVIPGIIVAEMSSSNNMISADYSSNIIHHIRTCNTQQEPSPSPSPLSLGGLVCQDGVPQLLEPFEILTMSPGINLNITINSDGQNQRYSMPNLRNNRLGLFWIVGRGITNYKKQNEKLIDITSEYQRLGWDYFIKY